MAAPPTLEPALRDLIATTVREVVREELRLALSQWRPKSGPPTDSSTEGGDRYLSPNEAAKIVGVAADTIRDWANSRELPRYSAGRRLRVKLSDLEAYLRRERSPEELSDADIKARVDAMMAAEATRCIRCHHLRKIHDRDRTCRAKKCTCSAWEPR